MKRKLLVFSLAIAASTIAVAQEREREQQRPDQQRQDQRREDQRGSDRNGNQREYRFRQEDSRRLRQHYEGIDRVDSRNRGRFTRGERLPEGWRDRMRPVPEAVIRELAPPPRGYEFGYVDGYCVVYDPRTGYIADVIDLTRY
jgi:Ni/Co efflux regulator RcnB